MYWQNNLTEEIHLFDSPVLPVPVSPLPNLKQRDRTQRLSSERDGDDHLRIRENRMTEHIVAVFATHEDADKAQRSLEDADIPATAIRRYTGKDMAADLPPTRDETDMTSRNESGGFWSWLFGNDYDDGTGLSTHQNQSEYERYLRAGNAILSVMVHDDVKVTEVVTLLENHSPLALDEQDAEGMGTTISAPHTETGTKTSVSPSGTEYSTGDVARPSTTAGMQASGSSAPIAAGLETSAPPLATPGTLPTPAPAAAGMGGTTGAPSTTQPHRSASADKMAGSEREEVLPLAEEELVVGKRQVDQGTTRVRRYVVESRLSRTSPCVANA
jgi:hypothetical protein